MKGRRSIVFCNTLTACQNILRNLEADIAAVECTQCNAPFYSLAAEKEAKAGALDLFAKGTKRVLVTDHEGECGIQYDNIDVVVNFSFPTTGASYLRRAQTLTKKNAQGTALSEC